MTAPAEPAHLRDATGGSQSVTNIELFFDLVYVFAITQLSHLLIHHLSWEGAWHTAILLLVVWWAWIYTAWMTNWFDPASLKVRLILIYGMLASLVMAAALPLAFGDRGAVFAIAYLALQLGRNAASLLLIRSSDHPLTRTYRRVFAWSLFSAPFWLAGGLVHEGLRPVLWIIALCIDLSAPLLTYAIPGRGRLKTSDWKIHGHHFAERFQLLLIIALGESIVVTGATAADAGLHAETIGAFSVAFLITAALWWLYFDSIAEFSTRDMATREDAGALARDAYTYLHLPIFAGIILTAIADELLILHPTHELSLAGALVTIGGPVSYLVGEALFRWRVVHTASRRRAIAIVLLLLIGVPAIFASAIVVALLILAVLLGLVVAEYRAT